MIRRLIVLLAALAAVFGLAGMLAPASSAAPASVQSVAQHQARQQNPAAVPSAVALAACPTGDGSASWGDGKVCPDPLGARVHYRDSLTDGYCVRVYFYSIDDSAWVAIGSQACTTGQWLTFATSAGKMCGPNARLYRGSTGQFFTMPSTAC